MVPSDRVLGRLRFPVASYTAEHQRSDTEGAVLRGLFTWPTPSAVAEGSALVKETLMDKSSRRHPLWALASALLLSFSGLAAAEPPSRAARLGFIGGTVSFSPAGQPDWVQAAVNRPLTTGDRLWTGGSSRAELQIGGAAIRMGPSTSMVLLNLDDRIAQVQLSQGTLKIRVRSLGPRQSFEVATPNLAFTLRRLGEYRIEVDPNDDATTVMVENGEAEVYGEGASYTVNSRGAYRFYGTDLSDYETVTARRDDDLDRWSRERDRRGDNSISARYVSTEVVGYEDLDANGSWRADATYGNVWTPHRVAADWSPYRDGHWSWVDPWGWTWVDDAPWGYAVSHYGRWAHINGAWGWVPGPRRERAVYAPALVAFVGGKNFQVSVSVGSTMPAAVGWFPLAPREVYQPSYPVSRGYFDNINRSNAVIAPTTITNVYNTSIVNTTNVTNITNVVYANQQVTGAVVAVPTQAFVQSQPVAKATVKLAPEAVAGAPVVRVASVAPVQQSVQGGAREAVTKPPVREHAVVARTAPPPAPVPFAVQQTQLAAKPGTPIDEAQRTQLKPAALAAAAAKVSVVATAPAPTPTALPPATAPAGRSPEARKAAAAKLDAGGGEGRKPDADKAAGATAEAARAESANADAAKAASAKAEESKTKAAEANAAEAKAAAAKAVTANAEAANAAAIKADTAKAAETKAAEAKVDAARASNARAETGKADEAKAERARAGAARADASKAEAALRADAAKVATARAEAAKAEAAKADAGKAAAAKAATESGEAAKASAAKAAEARADATRASSAKVEAMKAEAARADAARAATTKAESAKAEATRAADAKAAAARAEAEAAKAAALAKEPAAASPPKARASGPKSDADASPEDEKKKERRRS